MKILHTSDWHLDCRLYDRRRSDEHLAFLNWLRQTIIDQEIDVLIVSGDVYDNRTPTLESRKTYLHFLTQLYDDNKSGKSRCRHIIITAGNHDSAAFLEADKELLEHFDISVVGREPELIVVPPAEQNQSDDMPAIIAAVPFMSDVELRKSVEGESINERLLHLMEGIRDVYHNIAQQAEEKRKELLQDSPFVPIIATGHLFAQGASSLGTDGGERDIYVGTLEKFPAGDFPDTFDYIALGHLHVPQTVGGQDRIQYSGSPIPIGFGEANQTKRVVLVQWSADGKRTISSLDIPCFQKLVQIASKEKSVIEQKVSELVSDCQQSNQNVWLEVLYRGSEAMGMFNQTIENLLANSPVTLFALRRLGTRETGISRQFEGETLKKLDPVEVFHRAMTTLNVSKEEQDDLLKLYNVILEQVNENTQAGI